MLIVAAGSLLPSVEDWFGARRELRTIQPLLTELGRRQPDVGIGVRPRGPLVFRVAERMSLISDALFLEASAADAGRRKPVDAVGARCPRLTTTRRSVRHRVAVGATGGTGARDRGMDLRRTGRKRADEAHATFPGLGWLRQPSSYSDREWILGDRAAVPSAGPHGVPPRTVATAA